MRNIQALTILILVLLAASCDQGAQSSGSGESPQLSADSRAASVLDDSSAEQQANLALNSPQDAASAGSAALLYANSSEGMWEIRVEYPRFTSSGSVAATANAELATAAKGEFEEFLAQAQQEVPELKQAGSAAIYALEVTPVIATDLAKLCSAYVERTTATGGANANRTFTVFNYALDGDSVRQLRLSDLFYDGSDGIQAASSAVLSEINAWDSQPSSVASGGWTGLSAEQAERFVIMESGLLFLFNKGELGSSAEGTHTVLAPYDSIDGLDYEGLLQPLFDAQYGHNLDVLRSGRWVLAEIRYNNDTVLTTPVGDDGSLVQENWVEFREDGVSGQAGINSFNGDCEVGNDGTIKLGVLAMTKALNPPDSIADHFERNIPDVTSFLLKDAMLYLELPADVGTLVFMNAGIDGVW